jgi:hypothetical protein
MELVILSQELHTRRPATPILFQFQRLHKDSNTALSLRELLRIHMESLKVVREAVKRTIDRTQDRNNRAWEKSELLNARLRYNCQLLGYYDVTATTLIDQYKNLLSLV